MNSPKPNTNCFTKLISGVLICGCGGFFYLFFFPPYGYPKQAAKRTACLSNIKQLNLASIMYGTDNNDEFPPEFTFDGDRAAGKYMTSLNPYLKPIRDNLYSPFICNFDASAIRDKIPLKGEQGLPGKMSYVHATSLKNVIPDFEKCKRILKETTVPDPATTIYLRDPIREKVNGVPQSRHGDNQGFNFGYLDGHAKNRKENFENDL